jgi:hypothetical protein
MAKTVRAIPPGRHHRKKAVLISWSVLCFIGVLATVTTALVFRHSPLPVIRAGSITSVEGKLQQAERAHDRASRTVRLTEDEVNSVLHDRLQKSAGSRPDVAALRDVKIHLVDDRVTAYVVLGYRSAEITIDVEGKLYSREGLVQFVPTAGEIGSLPIPRASLVSAMQQVLSEPNEQQKLRLPPNISDLRVENSQILLRYD